MDGATINGSLTQTGGTLASFNSTIKGSVTVKETADNSLNDICGGTIGGSVTVSGIKETTAPNEGYFRLLGPGAFAPNGPCSTVAQVTPLNIGGSVNFSGNQAYVRLGNAKVGGSVTFTGNTSSVYDGNSGDISANVIKGSLNCSGNVPVLSNLLGVNTVTGAKKGQCAAF
jgi:hypothetical protein